LKIEERQKIIKSMGLSKVHANQQHFNPVKSLRIEMQEKM